MTVVERVPAAKGNLAHNANANTLKAQQVPPSIVNICNT
jgi:hypothetical protein